MKHTVKKISPKQANLQQQQADPQKTPSNLKQPDSRQSDSPSVQQQQQQSTTQSTQELALEVLGIDAEYRKPGVTDDLHQLESVNFDLHWDYTFPTLVEANSGYSKLRVAHHNSRDYRDTLYHNYPILQNLTFDNLMLAGGCVGHYLTSKDRYRGDLDFFLWGLSREQANLRLQKILEDLIQAAENINNQREAAAKLKNSYWNKVDMRFIRNRNGLTVFMDHTELQFIFRLYQTRSEILHGFDLGSSAVGFDGETVWLTTLSKFCYEYKVNLVDTSRRSTTYEHRLSKYFSRGFEIVMPRLDVNKLRRDYLKYQVEEVCDLPNLKFSYRSIIGNQIEVGRFLHLGSGEFRVNDNPTDYSMKDVDEYNAVYLNLKELLNDGNFFWYLSNRGVDILTKEPYINERDVERFYNTLRKKVFDGERLLVQSCRRYLTVVDFNQIIDQVLRDPNRPRVEIDQYLDQIFMRQKEFARDKVKTLASIDHSKLPWIETDPGTQLTSSFNPIIEDESIWYDKYYLN